MDRLKAIERTIMKDFRKGIWAPFVKAIKDYELIKENDRIGVCISGGKDSLLMAKLMQLLQRYSDFPFDLVYLVMDPGYTKENLEKIKANAKLLSIPIEVFESDIFEVVDLLDDKPCYLCARMRRGKLYAKAKEFGCNKIALGHHLSDVIETTLLGIFYGAQIQAMLPRLKSENFEGMELIRPMYCINEADIIEWASFNDLSFLSCACSLSSKDCDGTSKRAEIKALIKELKLTNPMIEANIFKSIHNVKLDTLLEYKTDGVNYSFLDKLRE